jgi:hypothetical protein
MINGEVVNGEVFFIRFMKEGEIRIKEEKASGRVSISLSSDHHQ